MIRFRWMALTTIATMTAPVVAASCGELGDSAERLACYDRLAECLTTHDADARLRCYDAAAMAASAAPAAPTPRDRDPFTVPGTKPPEPERERIVATIVEVNEDPRGLNYLTLDNGQVWRELSRSRVDFEAGTEVELRPGILGSVNLRIVGRDGYVKVRRVE